MIDNFEFIDRNADGEKERYLNGVVQLINKLSAEEANLIRTKLNEIIGQVNLSAVPLYSVFSLKFKGEDNTDLNAIEVGDIAQRYNLITGIWDNALFIGGDPQSQDSYEILSQFITSDQPLSLAQKKGDFLYGIIDQYTGESISLVKIASAEVVDNVIIFQLGADYYKRVTDGQINVKWFGAVGDGTNDDTEAIQKAFDCFGYSTIVFPSGLYKVHSSEDYALVLNKNRNIKGDSRTIIRGDFLGADTSILKISISDNDGNLDCRGWSMESISMFHNGGGKHGIVIEDGMPMLASIINNCSFFAGLNDEGFGLVDRVMAHSMVSNCQFDSVFMNGFDANTIDKCISFGKKIAITYDLIEGVRNNIVSNCTLVNRDGQVRIINGDNIRIENNQMELAQSYTPVENQSPTSSMVWIEGADRPVYNTVINSNNFGGGTSLDHSVYIDNGVKTVISNNNFISVNVAELYLTSNSKYNLFCPTNRVSGTISNPRTRTIFKADTVNLGAGNMGVVNTLTGLNGWQDLEFYMDERGVVNFLNETNGGTPAPGTQIAVIPVGYRPSRFDILSTDFIGTGFVTINPTTGIITVKNINSNAALYITPYQSATTED